MGAADGKESEFPHIHFEVGTMRGDVLPVVITLPDFTDSLNRQASQALVKDTPLPDDALQILRQAATCCKTCHLNNGDSGEVNPVGRNHGANCNGFSESGEGDLYEVTVDVFTGFAGAAELEVQVLPDYQDKLVPVMTTPCGITPSDLYLHREALSK